MLDGELDASDYRQIKSKYETEIARLQRKKAELSTINSNLLEYGNGALDLLRNLPDYYNKASLSVQQKIIASIFSGRVVFQNGTYQTKGYNEVMERYAVWARV